MNKSLSIPAAACLAALISALVGCSSEPTCDYTDAPYVGAQEVPSLQVPDGLTAPDHSSALVIPPANANQHKPEGKKSRCLDRPPSYYATGQLPKDAPKDASKDTPKDSNKN